MACRSYVKYGMGWIRGSIVLSCVYSIEGSIKWVVYEIASDAQAGRGREKDVYLASVHGEKVHDLIYL